MIEDVGAKFLLCFVVVLFHCLSIFHDVRRQWRQKCGLPLLARHQMLPHVLWRDHLSKWMVFLICSDTISTVSAWQSVAVSRHVRKLTLGSLDGTCGASNWFFRLVGFRKLFAPNRACHACNPSPSSADLTEAAASLLTEKCKKVRSCFEISFCSGVNYCCPELRSPHLSELRQIWFC